MRHQVGAPISFLFAKRLQILLVLLFAIGTQMPGAWRSGIEASLHAPFGLSSWAHFVMFTAMAWVASSPLMWSWQRIFLAALSLALLSEGMQYFAIDRHPRLIDVGIDLAGAGLGLMVAWAGSKYTARHTES